MSRARAKAVAAAAHAHLGLDADAATDLWRSTIAVRKASDDDILIRGRQREKQRHPSLR